MAELGGWKYIYELKIIYKKDYISCLFSELNFIFADAKQGSHFRFWVTGHATYRKKGKGAEYIL